VQKYIFKAVFVTRGPF